MVDVSPKVDSSGGLGGELVAHIVSSSDGRIEDFENFGGDRTTGTSVQLIS